MTSGIETQELSKKFTNGVTALSEISIGIRQGEFIALVGRSGSGKSTLMNILGGLDTPTTGTVSINGKLVDYNNRKNLIDIRRTQVGFVFQQFNLIPSLNALENVAYPLLFNYKPKEERNERAMKLLRMVGLGERSDHLPHQMSGGEQQRVAIARAMVGNSSVILADEPTGNLDSKTSTEIYQLMREVNKEKNVTFLIVTHERELASYCDRIIELRDGKVIA